MDVAQIYHSSLCKRPLVNFFMKKARSQRALGMRQDLRMEIRPAQPSRLVLEMTEKRQNSVPFPILQFTANLLPKKRDGHPNTVKRVILRESPVAFRWATRHRYIRSSSNGIGCRNRPWCRRQAKTIALLPIARSPFFSFTVTAGWLVFGPYVIHFNGRHVGKILKCHVFELQRKQAFTFIVSKGT